METEKKYEGHLSDCSTNNRGVPEMLGPCDCGYQESRLNDKPECFRCGYCGRQTDKNGACLTEAEATALDELSVNWDEAEQVHGECCG